MHRYVRIQKNLKFSNSTSLSCSDERATSCREQLQKQLVVLTLYVNGGRSSKEPFSSPTHLKSKYCSRLCILGFIYETLTFLDQQFRKGGDPMAFRLKSGSSISPIMDRICRDGRVSRMGTMAGRTVQISSTSCTSIVFEDSFSINMSVSR